MSKEVKAPEYASEVPFAPVNWSDRDQITGRILTIIDAAMPEGKQLDAVKDLIKESTKQFFIQLFNEQFEGLVNTNNQPSGYPRNIASYAIWRASQEPLPVTDSSPA